METINIITDNIAKCNIDITAEQLDKLDKYANLIEKWNKAYNLVGKSTLDEIYSRHILDSLQLVQYIKNQKLENKEILDFGSGAGMPAVMLAIMLPEYNITACERIGKKCQFLNQVRRELVLTNFKVNQQDVMEIKGLYSLITCRAVASIKDILDLTSKIATPSQSYLLPKGRAYLEEINEAKHTGHSFSYNQYKSIVDDESVVLELVKS